MNPHIPSEILSAAATGYGSALSVPVPAVLQAKLSGNNAASLSASVAVYGSNDPLVATAPGSAAKTYLTTFTLAGTGQGVGVSVDSAIWNLNATYQFLIANVTTITGTGATVEVLVGA